MTGSSLAAVALAAAQDPLAAAQTSGAQDAPAAPAPAAAAAAAAPAAPAVAAAPAAPAVADAASGLTAKAALELVALGFPTGVTAEALTTLASHAGDSEASFRSALLAERTKGATPADALSNSTTELGRDKPKPAGTATEGGERGSRLVTDAKARRGA